MGYEYLDHAADLAVRAWGPTSGEAFAEAARALTSSMVDLRAVRPVERREFIAHGLSLRLLLVDWLAFLVAEKDTSGLVFSRFEVEVKPTAADVEVRALAWGEALDPGRHGARSEVKGISLLGLSVSEVQGTWVATYVADV